jgi:hypothetical protein
VTETQEQQPRPGGKGRPTPKRSEAQKARKQPLVTPKGGGKAGKAGRDAARSAGAARRAEMREAMRTGDEANYPPMHAGPERRLVRDVVDARNSYGWLALPLYAVGLAVSLIPSDVTRTIGSFVLPFVLFLIIADSIAVRRAVREALDAKFPKGTKEPRKALLWYGVARNASFRRRRLPRPKVERGADLGL